MERDNYQCQDCGARGHLQVHHRSYQHVGRELRSELTTLCRHCHMRRHGLLWWQRLLRLFPPVRR